MMKEQNVTTKKDEQTGQHVPDRARKSGLMKRPDYITKKNGNPGPHAPDRARKSGFMPEPSGPTKKRLQYRKRAANNAEEIENAPSDVGSARLQADREPPRRHEDTKIFCMKNSSCLRVFVGACWQR